MPEIRMSELEGLDAEELVAVFRDCLSAMKSVAGKEVPDHSVRMRAAENLGKLCGLFDLDRGDIEARRGEMTSKEVAIRLRVLQEELTMLGARLPTPQDVAGEEVPSDGH